MSDAPRAVFLSYASQDAEAARKICDVLRSGGVEVWFDADGGLEHGDEWDAKIRRQIKECVLFIPIISANTQARHEGYFRLEWELAAQRAMSIASGVPFILPVVIDETREPDALVPDRFRMVQWTRLRGGEVPPDVQQRFLKLWSHRTGVLSHQAANVGRGLPTPPSERTSTESAGSGDPALQGKRALIAAAIVALVAAAGWWFTREPAAKIPPSTAGAPAATAKSSPPASEADQLIARAYAFFGKMNYTRDKLAAAEDLTRKATEVASDSARAWAARAYVQSSYILRGWDTGEKRREDTQTFANRALALDANEATAMLALTYVLNQQRAFAQAETLARRAIALRPDDYRPRTALTTAVGGQGRTAEALAIAQENVRLFPHEPLTHYGLALGYLIRGDLESALAGFEAALAVQPFASALLQKTILLVLVRNDVPAARATLDQLAPDDRTEDRAVGVALWLALVERQPARVQEAAGLTARNYFEDTVVRGAKAWSLAFAYQLAGKESLARQQWQAAEVVLRQRLRDHPEATDDQARLAVTLAWLSRADEAAREIAPFESAAREQPSPESAYLLAQYYTALGNAAKAAPYLAQVMNRWLFVSKNALRLDPQWDKLRGQPEFEALLVESKKETPATPPAPDAKSVAVLAFANLSDDKANEYFSDGISEELLNVLAKIPELKVSARTSAFSFKGKNVPIPEIGRQLGVAYVVEGSVRKSGARVRITAQLIKAADGFHVWSENFDRELKDVFSVQDEIAGLIAKNLSLKIGLAPAAPVAVNSEAYQHLLQARFFSRADTNDGWRRSIDECKAALALDPNLAPAWAEMARCYIFLARFSGIGLAEGFAAARPAAERALALAPDLPEANNAMGWVQRTADWDWRKADASFRRALELAPRNASFITDYAVMRNNTGHFDEAIELGRRAVELDPLNTTTLANLALFLGWAAHYDEAVSVLQRGVARAPGALEWYAYLSRFEFLRGHVDAAAAAAEAEASERYRQFARALVLLAKKDRAAGDRLLKELIEKYADREAGYVAEYYAYAGERDLAFTWLERARAHRETALVWILGQRTFDPIHADPRWPEFLRKLGLADDQLK